MSTDAWPDEKIEKLRVLWAEGHSTGEIGRRLNVSKNSVVGKAHRLNLPPRESPIKRNGEAKPVAPRRVGNKPTLPTLRCAPATALVELSMKYSGRSQPCCWPIGTPGKPSFHYCGADGLPGKPYCAEHASIAYVRVRDIREDAA
jgi:GcrA cell cycle regulator